jgi:prepilin-type N-terminal cleavage/methylation domain-containing protein
MAMHSQNRPPTIPRAGFTLIELVGVMAVIAILFAAVLPGAIDLIRTQRAVKEGEVLPKIAEALKRGIMREQVFPIYKNDANIPTKGNEGKAYWWNLAARHGGGSANEVRYPLSISAGSTTTRKLYFAKADWGAQSFFQVTGDGSNWLDDPLDPKELRLLLVSTTNPDLSLPDELNSDDFNAFWNEWAIGSDGNPASEDWSDYGLNEAEWEARAAELNVQRIDLRDLLCTVVIENRRAIEEGSGADLSSLLNSALGFWDRGSVSVSSSNLQDAEFILYARDTTEDLDKDNSLDSREDANRNGVLDNGEDLNANGILDSGEDFNNNSFLDHPAPIFTYVEAVIQTKRGRRLIQVEDPSALSPVPKSATVTVRGHRNSNAVSFEATLKLTDLAPIALINRDDPDIEPLYDIVNDSGLSESRYFLKMQKLLLGEPWPMPNITPLEYPEVGTFTITENFSTLRFDGLHWHY